MKGQAAPFYVRVNYTYDKSDETLADTFLFAADQNLGTPDNPKTESLNQATRNNTEGRLNLDEQLVDCNIQSIIYRDPATKFLREDKWDSPADTSLFLSDDDLEATTEQAEQGMAGQGAKRPSTEEDQAESMFQEDDVEEGPTPPKQARNAPNEDVLDLLRANLAKQYTCSNNGCDFTNSSEALTLDHCKTQCEHRKKKKTEDFRSGNLPEYEVIHKNRPIQKIKDDNNMLLCEARTWSLPANWQAHQNMAIRGQKELIRWNYNTHKVGLNVRNRRTLLEAHDTGFTDFRLCQFTDDALSKASGTVKPIQNKSKDTGMEWKEDFEPIPHNGLDQATKAWRNWVDINRFIHPGLMDCHAAYRVLQDNKVTLSVKTLEDFFTRHLENRANAATNGAGQLWDYTLAHQALSMITQTNGLANTNNKPFHTNNNNRNARNNRGGRTNTARGSHKGGPNPRNNRANTNTFNNPKQNTTTSTNSQPTNQSNQKPERVIDFFGKRTICVKVSPTTNIQPINQQYNFSTTWAHATAPTAPGAPAAQTPRNSGTSAAPRPPTAKLVARNIPAQTTEAPANTARTTHILSSNGLNQAQPTPNP